MLLVPIFQEIPCNNMITKMPPKFSYSLLVQVLADTWLHFQAREAEEECQKQKGCTTQLMKCDVSPVGGCFVMTMLAAPFLLKKVVMESVVHQFCLAAKKVRGSRKLRLYFKLAEPIFGCRRMMSSGTRFP